MIHQSIHKNHRDPLCKGDIRNPGPVAVRTKRLVLAMAHRPDNGDREVACVAKSGHDDRKTEVLGRWATNQGDNVSKDATNDGANEDIKGDEPPQKEVIQGDRLAQVDEDHAREEEGENKLRQELECGPRDELGLGVGEDDAKEGQGQEFHQGDDRREEVFAVGAHVYIHLMDSF